jgi:lysophospholipase L1-like esterase
LNRYRSLVIALGVPLLLMGCVDDSPSSDGQVLLIDDAGADGSINDAVLERDAADGADGGSLADVMAPPAGDAGPPPLGECAPEAGEVAIHGLFYLDDDESERSTYTGGPTSDDAQFQGGIVVIGNDAAEAETCDDGSYVVTGLEDGVVLAQPVIEEGRRCTTANCPGRFAGAIADDRRPVMVTFGDSIAVIGDQPMFPERIRTLFAGLTDIDNRNVAVGGSTSVDWLPERRYFGERLAPHLEDADLLIITIGGNDILQYVSGLGIPNDIPAAVEGARQVVLRVIENMTEILAAIRAVNPDADIAYCLYADYSQATEHPIWGLVGNFLGPDTVADILELARRNFPTDDEHLILIDMFGAAQGLPLHDYLYDQLHFNDLGQSLYAEEVFETLGGVLVGESPLGSTGTSPLGLRRSYGVSPMAGAE